MNKTPHAPRAPSGRGGANQPDRQALKRRRNVLQADAVQEKRGHWVPTSEPIDDQAAVV